MLHTKFCRNQTTGSGEDDIKRVFAINGHSGHLGHVTNIKLVNFHFFVSKILHIQFG